MPKTLTRRALAALSLTAAAAVVAVVGASPAGACGGLVGENGTIQLVRTTTLAAHHDGVQRYITSFEFSGTGESVGSIVPLPAEPTAVERGGDWTLQRLAREVAPSTQQSFAESAVSDSADSAEVILETQIDALDITVLKGGGDEVGIWAEENGFLLTPDAPEVLDFYGERSPYFMAARFDASRAAELGQAEGDGTPIMVTIPIDRPWVPLRILGLGLESNQVVEADVFLLTDDEPDLLAGGRGLTFGRSEAASASLLDDLRSDVGMEWLPQEMWLSYLQLGVDAGELDYDLAISTDDARPPTLADAGIEEPSEGEAPARADDGGWGIGDLWPVGAGVLVAATTFGVLAFRGRRDRRDETTAGVAPPEGGMAVDATAVGTAVAAATASREPVSPSEGAMAGAPSAHLVGTSGTVAPVPAPAPGPAPGPGGSDGQVPR